MNGFVPDHHALLKLQCDDDPTDLAMPTCERLLRQMPTSKAH